MTEDVLFGEAEQETQTPTQSDKIEELEERISQLENAVLPSIRKVQTDNGPRFIIEQGTERWYKPETLKQRLHGGDE